MMPVDILIKELGIGKCDFDVSSLVIVLDCVHL